MNAKTMAAMAMLGATAIFNAGCRDAAAKIPAATPVIVVEATPAPTPTPEDFALEISGDLRPAIAAEISFKIGGQLATVRVSRGDAVKAGQVIATLSDAEARAQLAIAEAAVAAAEAQAAIAADQAKRVAELAEGNAVPGSQAVAAKHAAEAAAAISQQARAARELARVNADNPVLRAAFDGRVVRVKDATGETMGPGMPVARLEALDRLVLHATISEGELDRVKVGDTVAVKTSGGREVAGRVRAVVRSLDGISRRAPVEIDVPNANGELAAGAYVRATLRRPVAAAN